MSPSIRPHPRSLAFGLALLVGLSLVAPAAMAQSSATLKFDNQSSGGRSVVVAETIFPEAGFMAIHDATLLSKEDPFGSVVGVSELLPAGTHANVRVTLTRALSGANETLIAMPHKDTNGNGIYDFVSSKGAQDGPFSGGPQSMKTFAGDIVVKPAVVNNTASLAVTSPQNSSGASAYVDRVELSQGGFLAFHDSTLVSAEDPFGSVIGVSPFLAAGVHHDVLVSFTRNVTAGPVIPMPHKDTNGNKVYDFVTSQGAQDGPFAGDVPTFVGSIVIAVVELRITQDASVAFPATSTGGHLVVVPQTFLPEPGFVAIHDSTLVTAEDPFGSVIGVSEALPAGMHHNVTVELGPVPGNDKAFTSGANDTLIAMPHKDSNRNGAYDFITSQGAQDGPFGGANGVDTFVGKIVIAASTVTRSATQVFEDQQSDGRSVVIAHVDLSEGGFLALHDLSLVTKEDPFGSVVGVSQKLNAGSHENVRVTIGNVAGGRAGPLNTSQTLVAMPHKDTNNNGAYDFVSSKGAQDGPFPGTVPTFVGNLSIALARVHVPVAVAQAASPTPAATPTPAGTPAQNATPASPTATTPTGASPAPATSTPTGAVPSPAENANNDTPGFGIVALLAALVVGAIALRRRG